MRREFLLSICGALLSVAIMAAGFLNFPPGRYAPAISIGPIFMPADEIALQAAVAADALGIENHALLNKRLREIDIRTALEDTARLHDDLG